MKEEEKQEKLEVSDGRNEEQLECRDLPIHSSAHSDWYQSPGRGCDYRESCNWSSRHEAQLYILHVRSSTCSNMPAKERISEAQKREIYYAAQCTTGRGKVSMSAHLWSIDMNFRFK
jgi:hypothetical protein